MYRGHAQPESWIACCLGRGELAPLTHDDVEELSEILDERFHPAGALLSKVGEKPARVHVVRRGRVELTRLIGRRRVVVQVLHSGDVFGDVPLLVRTTELFDARALEDAVVLSADSVSFFQLLQTRPRVAQRWLVSLASRMAATQARLVDLLAGDLESRVAVLLTREAEGALVRLPQALLADLLGARRTSVNRVLKRLEARGAVRLDYGQVEIIDPAELAAARHKVAI